jgi:nucleoside-diphosphate-sugar epimerase
VVALDRSGRLKGGAPAGCEVVQGDLLDPDSYRDALATCDTVVHLAAATGNASREQHHRVNAEGAGVVVEAARRAGVTRFLFVSSVAVSFPDLTGYHYAQAKARGETLVRQSGLRFLIVRPTMILGPGAPILASLEKLATLPVAVLPGSGRAQVEPIHVDEVASCLVAAVEADAFTNEAVAIGGRDRVSMETLIRRLRVARRGKEGPLVRIPLPFLQVPLKLAEAAGLGRLLPITAGQLSSFRFDGVGTPSDLQKKRSPSFGLDEMLGHATQVPDTSSDLDAECDVFTRHLIGRTPDAYVRAKYLEAHTALPALSPRDAFDSFLVSFARRGRLFAKVAGAHAALLAPAALLRKKMVLLLAILETCPPTHRMIDAPVGGRPFPALLALGGIGVSAVLALVVGSLILLPIRGVLALASGGSR